MRPLTETEAPFDALSGKTISFASVKGGAGKTTVAHNVAALLRRRVEIRLVDLDPTQQLSRLNALRDPARRLECHSGVAKKFSGVQLVDTPGTMSEHVLDAMLASDLIVMPLAPSPMDLGVVGSTADRLRQMGRLSRAIFVINKFDVRTGVLNDFEIRLGRDYGRPIVVVCQRIDYSRAMTVGSAAVEINDAAMHEIRRLIIRLRQIAARRDRA